MNASNRSLRFALAAAPALLAVGLAASCAWTCDDAWISFRYARQLVEGNGLVFNPGERVEGYTNFSWTLLVALGLAMDIDVEIWTYILGLGGLCGLVVLLSREDRLDGTLVAPSVAVLAALHPDLRTWSTGGLETILFTLLGFAGFQLVSRRHNTARSDAAAGAVLGLATLTRPDGALLLAVCGLYLLARSWPLDRRVLFRRAMAYGLPAAALVSGHLAFRLSYYGEWVPNTAFAKSAAAAWWGQGAFYFGLWVRGAWPTLVIGGLAVLGWRDADRHGRGRLLLAATLIATYTAYVMRVGGDFMYARLLVPTIPFWLALGAPALAALWSAHRRVWIGALAGLALATLLTPRPVGLELVRGIHDESALYSEELREDTDRRAAIVERYLADLDVTVAFYGTEARLVERARLHTAIECETGLTDATIARRPIEERAAPGHEKGADLEYLRSRNTRLSFSAVSARRLKLEPRIDISFDGVRGFVITWDAALMAELKRRGARFEDFVGALDHIIEQLPKMPLADAQHLYRCIEPFYFRHTPDPVREAAFLKRLALP